MQKLCAIIMAGGIGSRFWPASRAAMPKQFLDITGNGHSMLRTTFNRLTSFIPSEQILVVTGAAHTDLVKEHLPELKVHQIIGEPFMKNTAPAALLGTLAANHLVGGNATVIMTPADQIVGNEEAFAQTLQSMADYATKNASLVTIGIAPEYPHTGYGYIHCSKQKNPPYPVIQFTEKPNLERAEAFLADGSYLWNAGIFAWSSNTILTAFKTHAPDIYNSFEPMMDGYKPQLVEEVYDNVRNESIDYAIFENASNVVAWPGNFGWTDVGSWRALHEIGQKDEHHNLILAEKQIIQDCNDSLIRVPEGKVVVAKGLDGFLVIDTGDALVIYPKDEDQDLKTIRQQVIKDYGKQFE